MGIAWGRRGGKIAASVRDGSLRGMLSRCGLLDVGGGRWVCVCVCGSSRPLSCWKSPYVSILVIVVFSSQQCLPADSAPSPSFLRFNAPERVCIIVCIVAVPPLSFPADLVLRRLISPVSS